MSIVTFILGYVLIGLMINILLSVGVGEERLNWDMMVVLLWPILVALIVSIFLTYVAITFTDAFSKLCIRWRRLWQKQQ